MAAYDNVSLPGPPDIAHAGNMAAQLYDMLTGVGKSYEQGKNFQYQQRNQDLFRGGVPTVDGQPNGPMDYAAMLRQVLQAGGAPAIGSATPLISAEAGQQIGNAISPGGAQPPNIGQATTAHAGPANITGNFGGGQPSLSATGSDSAGAESVRSLTAGIANGRPVQDTTIANYARAIGVDPDAPLSADQEARARRIIGKNLGVSGASPTNTGGVKPVVSSGYEQDQNNTNEATPVGSTGGAQISPNPQGAGPGKGETFGSRPNAPQIGARQTPIGTEAEARRLLAAADYLSKQAATKGALNKEAAKAALDTADKYRDRAKQIFESIGKYNEPTQAQKDVESGAAQREAQIKDDTTRYGKQMAAIQGSAQAANRQLEHVQLAESLYKNPDFYSGTGESLNLGYKRVLAALGIDPGRSLPQEAFRKTMAAAVLNQVEQLKDDTAAVGGGGRIFQAQIELMEKAANNPDNSIAANRLLTEVSKRSALEAKNIAKMANSYKGGHPDAQFAQMVDDYYTKHPMFTPDEMRDIRLIAPPVAPKLDSEADARAWARKAGLRPGEPMKLPSGRIVPAP